jgi:DNA-binding MarR family transcriptional regulator
MSRIVAGLARSRLIEVTRDPDDARRQSIRATAAGKRLLQKARRLRIEFLAAHLDRLSAEEIRMLGKAAEIMERLFGD